MLYAIHLLDKHGTADIRAQVRPAHKAHLSTVADRVAFAGPLLADDGKTAVGSLLVIDFPSRTGLRQRRQAIRRAKTTGSGPRSMAICAYCVPRATPSCGAWC